MAVVRWCRRGTCCGSTTASTERSSRRRSRAEGPGDDEHLGAVARTRPRSEAAPKAAAPVKQHPATTDAVAERAHRDQEPGHHEPVDVGDPQQLGARGLEVPRQRRDRQDRAPTGPSRRAGTRRRSPPGRSTPCALPGARRLVLDLHLSPLLAASICQLDPGWPETHRFAR